MPVQLYTEDALFGAAMGYFRALFAGAPTPIDLSDRSFLGLLSRSFARVMVLAQLQILQAGNDSVPAYQQDADGNIRSRCSSEALDAWAFVFGLPSGKPGVYGRRGATIATGGAGLPIGVAGTVIPVGSQATDATGQIIVQTTALVTLAGSPNSVPVRFVTKTTGAQANLPVATQLTWTAPAAGLTSSITLSAGLSGAEDLESDTELVSRLLQRLQQPPRGGTAADYRYWAEESTDSNGALLDILRAFVFPERSGMGSVDLVPTLAGKGQGRSPTTDMIAAVQAFVNKLRPVTATVNVFAPYMPAGNALRVRVRATPSAAKNGTYAWDWLDGGISTTITAHTANTVTVASIPGLLQTAYLTGGSPRLQVVLSGASGEPLPLRRARHQNSRERHHPGHFLRDGSGGRSRLLLGGLRDRPADSQADTGVCR